MNVKVYAVRREYDFRMRGDVVRLDSADGVATKSTVKLPTRPLLAGCRAVVSRDSVTFSAEEAVTRFVNEQLAEIERLHKQIQERGAWIDAARTLTTETPTAAVESTDAR